MAPEPWMDDIWSTAQKDQLRALQDLTADLSRTLRAAAQEAQIIIESNLGDSVSEVIRRAQASESLRAIRYSQAELWSKVDARTRAGIEQGTSLANQGMTDMLEYLLRTGADPALAEGIRVAAEQAFLNLESRYINNINLSPTVYKNEALSNGRIARIVDNGILTNKSAKEIARDVVRFIRPDVPGGTSYAAMRLGRTELNNAFHETTRRMAANQPWVEAARWNLSSSHPRPDPCDDAKEGGDRPDGTYSIDRVPDKPHPQCLCYVTYETLSPKEFISQLNAGSYDDWIAASDQLTD